MCLALRLGRWVRAVQTTERIYPCIIRKMLPKYFAPDMYDK